MLFGRSLYGGALYPRQVTAAGATACSATTSAKATVAFRDASGTFATATVASATGVRNVLPVAVAPLCMAGAAGTARVDFALAVTARATGAVTGTPRASFYGAVSVVGAASPSAKIIRTIVQRIPNRTNAYADATAEPQVYVYVAPARVMCYANPFGTYWFVGRGACAGQASGAATASIIRAVAGGATASGTAQGVLRADMQASGAVGATADPAVDLLTTIAGIRYWDAHAAPLVEALATGEAYVYSVALAVARALTTGGANSRRAAGGASRCSAAAQGAMQRVQPEYASVVITSFAEGGARAHLAALASTRTEVAGAATAAAKTAAAGRGATEGTAAAATNVVWIDSPAGQTAAAATASKAAANRRALASGAVAAGANESAAARAARSLAGQSSGLASPAAEGAFHPKVAASAAVEATALAEATNRVNDAGQRLSTRVVVIAGEQRTLSISEPPRRMAVGGMPRRLAA